MKTPSFSVSAAEADLIRKIVARARRAGLVKAPNYPALSAMMDLTACHANGCALDLPRLLETDNVSFNHDITGIARHIDRDTGQLRDCFVPRCALPAAAEAQA